jgi:hypothetical protein
MDHGADIARQLVDALSEALERGDAEGAEYAAGELQDFLDETDDATPVTVLVALLDLPLDASTLTLLGEVSGKLRRRGRAVVEPLVGAVAGEAPPSLTLRDLVSVAGAVGALLEAVTRRPGLPPCVENALSVLAALDRDVLLDGLVEVLEGPAGERVKEVAAALLVDIGEPAVGRLEASLERRGGTDPWTVDALVDLRERGALAAGEADAPAAADAIERELADYLERRARENGESRPSSGEAGQR